MQESDKSDETAVALLIEHTVRESGFTYADVHRAAGISETTMVRMSNSDRDRYPRTRPVAVAAVLRTLGVDAATFKGMVPDTPWTRQIVLKLETLPMLESLNAGDMGGLRKLLAERAPDLIFVAPSGVTLLIEVKGSDADDPVVGQLSDLARQAGFVVARS